MLSTHSISFIVSCFIAVNLFSLQEEQSLPITKSVQSANAGPVVEKLSDNALPLTLSDDTKKSPSIQSTRQRRIEQCLARYFTKPVNADKLRPWSIMHGVLAFGLDARVATRGHQVNAVDYLCANGLGHDRRILSVENGKLNAHTGQGFQGHEGQLLAILAQVQCPIDHPITIDGQSFTVRDLVEYEQLGCRSDTELTFKLMGLSCYLESDAVWKNDKGEAWDISRLINEEITQPINGAACGGVHRLMALSYALEIRRTRDEPIDGQWQRISSYLSNYYNYIFSLQNPDGSFSTDWFEGISNSGDAARKIYTTGHLLEWLAFSLPDEKLKSAETARAVDQLIALLEVGASPSQELDGLDVGPKCHALRALRLYEIRVFGEPSDHQQLATIDKSLIVTPAEVAALQPKTKIVLPTATQPNARQVSTPTSSSNRSARFFRRR